MPNSIEKYAIDLHQGGYDVVPIPFGSKGCFVKGWQTCQANEEIITYWASKFAGCGIRGPRTIGVDIDCRDENLTQYMLTFVRERLGFAPHRVGMSPKALLPYRCEKSFRKVKSREFFSPEGNKHMLEVLAEGQQFVASHIHPDTNQPYIWHYEDGGTAETLTIPWADLPLITEADARDIVAEFETQCQNRGWKQAVQKNHNRVHSPVKNRGKYTEKDVSDMLSCLDPNMSYPDWLNVGMSLHHGGFSVELWDHWSKNSPKYKTGECQSKWASFSSGGQA